MFTVKQKEVIAELIAKIAEDVNECCGFVKYIDETVEIVKIDIENLNHYLMEIDNDHKRKEKNKKAIVRNNAGI